MAKGAAWMVAFKFIERTLGLVSTVILARVLIPDDFGVVAMAMSVVALLELVSMFSFDVALIQDQDAGRPQFDTAWTFNVLVKGATALAVVGLAYPASAFYGEPRLVLVVMLLSLGLFVQGFENIGVVFFRKDMQFHRDFGFLLGKKLAAFLVTVPLAIMLRSYWALVVGILTGRIAGVLLSYVVQSYRPRFSLVARRQLFNFSKWLLINNYIDFFNTRAGDFIIGRIAGAGALGVYAVSYEISTMPTTQLAFPINRAVFPGYAKSSRDPEALRRGYLDVIGMIVLFAIPAGVGVAVLAEPIVQVFLGGGRWLAGVPIIQMLAIYGVLSAVQTNNGYVFLAVGKPRMITLLAGVFLLLMVPLVATLTLKHGLVGAAWGFLAAGLIMLPINYALLFREIGLSVSRYVSRVWRPLSATAAMYATVAGGITMMGPAEQVQGWMLRLVGGTVVGAAVYFAVLLGTWKLAGSPSGAESTLLGAIRERLRRRGRAPAGS
jgi:O-antigen/teichoic acid export membrane protein